MAGNGFTLVRPKTVTQNTLQIAAGSPLAVQGVFLEILRERFSADSGLSWTWDEDPTLTGIIIEADANEETQSRSTTPAVYVTRQQSTPTKVVLGDRAGVSLPDHKEGFYAVMHLDMSLDCVSNDYGESVLVADAVQHMLICSQDIIQREFGFHDMSHSVMGATEPLTGHDIPKWNTQVTFTVDFEVRWSQVPIRPLLQQLAQRVTASGVSLFRDSVLNSMRRGSSGGT